MKLSLFIVLACSPLLLLGAGCSNQGNIPNTVDYSSKASSYEPMTPFLLSGAVLQPSNNGKLFVAYEDLGEKREGVTTTRYIWAVIEEYYAEQGQLKQGSGMSAPLALHLVGQGDHASVVDYEMPRDGNLYGPDIAKIFPKTAQDKIFRQETGLRDQITLFIERNEKDAQAYFFHNR